jgi:hypothetical protein
MNLGVLHLSAGVNRFLEPVAFAFFRAVLLACAALYLLRRQKQRDGV